MAHVDVSQIRPRNSSVEVFVGLGCNARLWLIYLAKTLAGAALASASFSNAFVLKTGLYTGP